MTVAQDRRRRERLDKAVARGFVQPIQRVIKREEARLLKATTAAAAVASVSESEWIKTLVKLWTSDPIWAIWAAQQEQLGTDFPPTAEARKILTEIATSHAKSIADTRRARIERIVYPDA